MYCNGIWHLKHCITYVIIDNKYIISSYYMCICQVIFEKSSSYLYGKLFFVSFIYIFVYILVQYSVYIIMNIDDLV